MSEMQTVMCQGCQLRPASLFFDTGTVDYLMLCRSCAAISRCPECGEPTREEDIPGSQMDEVLRYCTARCGYQETV